MKTSEIISAQFKFLSDNSKEYFNILLIPAIFSIASYYIYIIILTNITSFLLFIGILCFIINLILFYRAAVSIHRLVILNEHQDNYAIKVKETFLYGLYSILLFIITLSPLIISIFFPIFLLGLFGSAWGFLLIPIGFIWLFIAFPFFALNLPMVAIGKKISFFKMFEMSKGFRLTLFFQQLLFVFFTWLIGFLTAFFPTATFSFLINLFFSVYLFAIFLSCLSKTYILWEENNKIDN